MLDEELVFGWIPIVFGTYCLVRSRSLGESAAAFYQTLFGPLVFRFPFGRIVYSPRAQQLTFLIAGIFLVGSGVALLRS